VVVSAADAHIIVRLGPARFGAHFWGDVDRVEISILCRRHHDPASPDVFDNERIHA
jgi:hypothetical protein